MNSHYDAQAIQEYIDGRLDEAGRQTMRSHLEECRECAAVHRGLTVMDGLLRRMPLEQAHKGITDAVLARIAHAQRETWLDRLLQPRFMAGLVFILFGVAGSAGALAVMQQEPGAVTSPGWKSYLDGVLGNAGSLTASISAFLMRLAPQLFTPGALEITLTVVLLVPVFLYADHVLARRRVMG